MEQTDVTPRPYFMLYDVVQPVPRITSSVVMGAVAQVHGMTVAEMLQPCRERRYAWARHQVMWLLDRLRPDMSYTRVARALKLTDHTTVIHGVNRVDRSLREGSFENHQIQKAAEHLGFSVDTSTDRAYRLSEEQVERRRAMGAAKYARLAAAARAEALDTVKPVQHVQPVRGATAGDVR